ncbi:MAG: hypothetical protein H6709_09495 [Kofleriaceae bacterium]|nr:hypothetical protein [Myxococcales bacterium]MCB9561587.1 hypothetical protein [Kofleriaceae bacterium]MCB9572305.1 hypothetical protein [Kofleriaceae bacterium]
MRTIPLLSVPLLAALAAPAAADPEATPASGSTAASVHTPYSFGARVGGYGFRRDDGDRRSAWDECRMNGMGVFMERDLSPLGGHLFVEGGLDLYFSESFPQRPADDLPIDRTSGLITAAVGLRMDGPWRTSGYAQVGAGLELTRVSVPYGDGSISDQLALPAGFLGVGGEIDVGHGTHLGASLRAHVMGNFSYDPADLEMQPGWTSPPAADEVFAPAPDAAAQGQFYLRKDL